MTRSMCIYVGTLSILNIYYGTPTISSQTAHATVRIVANAEKRVGEAPSSYFEGHKKGIPPVALVGGRFIVLDYLV